jgi:glycosyltransferase involved in cell wall biosynthesis
MERLSVILVTLNEERNIDRCLGSVRWADEKNKLVNLVMR